MKINLENKNEKEIKEIVKKYMENHLKLSDDMYSFNLKYFLHIGINTKDEILVQITEKEFDKWSTRLNNSKNAMIRLELKYEVKPIGFNNAKEVPVTLKIFNYIFTRQIYEENKIRHEKERYMIKRKNTQDIILNAHSKIGIPNNEDIKLDLFFIKRELDKILPFPQNERYFKYKYENKSFQKIADEEHVSKPAVYKSIKNAKRKLNNLKKFLI